MTQVINDDLGYRIVHNPGYDFDHQSLPLIAVFVDLQKAFDSIPKRLHWRVLLAIGVPVHLVEVIWQINEDEWYKLGRYFYNLGQNYNLGNEQFYNLG